MAHVLSLIYLTKEVGGLLSAIKPNTNTTFVWEKECSHFMKLKIVPLQFWGRCLASFTIMGKLFVTWVTVICTIDLLTCFKLFEIDGTGQMIKGQYLKKAYMAWKWK